MSEKSIIIPERFGKTIRIQERGPVRIDERPLIDPITLEERSVSIPERKLTDPIRILGQEYSFMVEKQKTLLVNANGALLEWVESYGGLAHWEHVKHGVSAPDAKYLYVTQSAKKEQLKLQNAPADLVTAKSFTIQIYYNFALNISASTWGIQYELRTVAGVKLAQKTHWSPSGSGFSISLDFPGTFALSPAEVDDLEIRMVSVGVGWTVFAAIVRVDEIQLDVTADCLA